MIEELVRKTPLRCISTVDETATVVESLLSPPGSHITGTDPLVETGASTARRLPEAQAHRFTAQVVRDERPTRGQLCAVAAPTQGRADCPGR